LALSTALQFFRFVATEFSGLSNDDVNNWIQIAADRHSGDAFGSNYEQAMAYYAAHLAALQGRAAAAPVSAGGGGAGVGSVVSQKAGDIGVGYGGTGSGGNLNIKWDRVDASLTQTSYGLEYLAIRGTRSAVFPFVSEVGTT